MQLSLIRLLLSAAVFVASGQSAQQLHSDELQGEVFSIHESEATGLAFLPDGKSFISTSLRDDRISAILIGNEPEDAVANDDEKITGAWSHTVAVNPDGTHAAIAGFELPEPDELRIWNAGSGELLHVWKAKNSDQAGRDHCAISGIAFSLDSGTISLACSDGNVRLWNVLTQQVRSERKGHRGGVHRVAYRADGGLLATADGDRTVRLGNPDTGQQLQSLAVDSPKINALSFSPEGSRLIACGGDFLRSGEVRMWNVQPLKQK